MTQTAIAHDIGEWCWHLRHAAPCRVVDRQAVWGETAYRVWLPSKDAVVRARSQDLAMLDTVQPTADQILHTAAATKLLDAMEDNLLLAPIQSSVVPLPHQLYALNRAMSKHRIRYLLADEVGLGKTIEAGLILRELKLRGMVHRVLVVAPKGLIRQWQAEMQLHFGEKLQFVEPSELAAFRQLRTDEDNLWRMHDQVICSLDSVKPMEGRRGWSQEQVTRYNQERFEDLISASWDLVIIDESHRLGGSTDQVARYKLGAALAEAAPYLLLLSATPHQGKTDQFMRLMQLIDRESFPNEGSVSRERAGSTPVFPLGHRGHAGKEKGMGMVVGPPNHRAILKEMQPIYQESLRPSPGWPGAWRPPWPPRPRWRCLPPPGCRRRPGR